MKTRDFLGRLEHRRIVQAIQQAELRTSGEVRVFVSRYKAADPVAAAQKQFQKLGMERTKDHNAVLIWVAPRSQSFAVIGDSGVHAHCGDDFWRQLVGQMGEHFAKEGFTNGLIHAIERTGQLLGEHFPRQKDDVNELSDDVAHD